MMRGNRWASWSDLIDLAREVGIPHFQRGHVWEHGHVAALLESMFEGSPCGSMVLWRSPASSSGPAEDIGEALVREKSAEVSEWLIDGQQRLRSLLGVLWDAVNDPPSLMAPRTRKALDARKSCWQVAPVFHGLASDPASAMTPDGEGGWVDDGATRTWFVSLPRLASLAGDSSGPWTSDDVALAARFAPFRYLSRRRPTGRTRAGNRPAPRGPRGLVPMSFVLAQSDEESRLDLERLGSETSSETLGRELPWVPHCLTGFGDTSWSRVLDDETLRLGWTLLRAQLAGARGTALRRLVTGQWFAVGWLPEDCSFDDAVAAYVRINRAGVRVRPEERAFAELIRHVPQTPAALRHYSEAHQQRMWKGTGAYGDSHDRRWLAHATERSFGFALWMRAAIRDLTIALVPESATKAGWLSLDSIERWTIQDRLGKANEAVLERIFAVPERASCILLVLDDLLSGFLRLDNPMALPDARSLFPMIDLLSRHETLLRPDSQRESARDVVLGNLLLWSMVHPDLNQSHMSDLLAAGARPGGVLVAIEAMVRALLGVYLAGERGEPSEPLPRIVERLVSLVGASFDRQRQEAKTLRDRTVGLLYGIERRMREASGEAVAREFDWSRIPYAGELRKELPLQARWPDPPKGVRAPDLALERQHIVPFSLARQLVPKPPANHAATSDVNSVANLTWLSRRQNSFDGGLGGNMVDLRLEPTERLDARGLSGPARLAYDEIFTRWSAQRHEGWKCSEADKAAFRAFREARGRWIADQMNRWLEEALDHESWWRAFENLRD
jgi:hypothetical protein